MTEPTFTQLQDLVAQRLDVRWDDFAEAHPHLAAAIARSTLVESTVALIVDDPEYQRAIEAAGRDRVALHLGGRIAALVDRVLDRVLRV